MTEDTTKRGIRYLYLCILFAQGCVAAPHSISPQGKIYYTKANIWYTTPTDIKSTNYHTGALIPFGTKVTIESINRKRFMFRTEHGVSFTVIYMKRHSTISLRDHFQRYFSENDPNLQGGLFQGFSNTEKQNIKNGNVAIGMTKEAVLASYGYPPSHATSDLKADYWRYWVIGRQEVWVSFIENRVSNIQRVNVSGPPPGLKHITSVSSLSDQAGDAMAVGSATESR